MTITAISIQHEPFQDEWTAIDDGWHQGEVKINDRTYTFDAKVYNVGSKFGIRHGRISKLRILDETGTECLAYDRGWDIRPKNDEARAVLALILNEFK